MARIWNHSTKLMTSKHKQFHPVRDNKHSNRADTPLEPHASSLRGRRKVFVAMSGGVDSSVAAKLLKNQGHDVMGIFLHFWKDPSYAEVSIDARALTDKSEGEETENKCCSMNALLDARRVCQKIGMPFYTLNFSKEFKSEIVDNFINEYKIGHTPNPCVRCNKFVKLGLLIKRAQKLGFDKVASGHYARLRREITNSKSQIPKIKLLKAKDKDKDQSYFLYALTQEQLSHLEFPLGDYTKVEVRKMAKKFGLPTASKRESQEICFISGKSHNDFLRHYLKLKSGPICLAPLQKDKIRMCPICSGAERSEKHGCRGIKLGQHQGLPLYTIGQRKGIEIGGTGPYYAARVDYKTNTLYVVSNPNDPILFGSKLIARNVNWISGFAPEMPLKCDAVIRYRHKPVKCAISKKNESGYRMGRNDYLVEFKEPQRAITPGQSVVFYKGKEVLGGGLIDI